MLKLKITWPLLFLLLFALFAWLIRAAAPPIAQTSAPKKRSTRAAYARPADRGVPRRHTVRQQMIINIPPVDADGADDRADTFDAETRRLDREAMEAAATFSATHASAPFSMRKGAWQE